MSKNTQRVVLSAGKAFVAAAVAVLVASGADWTNLTVLKALAFPAVVAGLDAAFKAVQIGIEKKKA